MAPEQLPALLRRLVLPVYLPTALYGIGAAAIVPVVPLIGLDLGLSVPQVALLSTVVGLLAVIGPLPTGQLVARIGERAALVVGGLVSILAVLGCLVAAWSDGATPFPVWAPALFCASILLMALGDLTWDLGRQTYIADEVPLHLRARAMTIFGGTMRVGRIIGPLVGAAVITLAGPAAAFLVHLVGALAGLVLITLFVPPRLATPRHPDAAERVAPPRGSVLRPLLLVGVAVLVLTAARTNRDLLLPLLGHEFGHPEVVVSLVFAVAAAVELGFILPAGTLMDRFGRAAVLVPCLALMGVGYLIAPLSASVPGFVVVSLVFAIGNGLGAGINKTLSADLTPSRNRAGWLGLWNSLTNTGALLGPAVVAVTATATSVLVASFATGWLTLAGAAWALWWLPRFVPGRPREPVEPQLD